MHRGADCLHHPFTIATPGLAFVDNGRGDVSEGKANPNLRKSCGQSAEVAKAVLILQKPSTRPQAGLCDSKNLIRHIVIDDAQWDA